MADQYQSQQDEQQGDRAGRRSYQQFPQRSAASMNWRNKDETPRAEPQARRGRGGAEVSSSPRGTAGSSTQGETSDTRLYVGNLLYSATRDDIANYFSEHGFTFSHISMSLDPATGRNPSYCFVDFDTADEASRAMNELNGQDFMGRIVRISPGVAKKQSEGGYQTSRASPGSFGQRSRGGYQNGQQDYEPRSYNAYSRPSNNTNNSNGTYNTSQSRDDTANTKRLYVGSLPSTTTSDQITQLFTSLGVTVTKVSHLIAPHESKKDLPGDHHYLFVDLERAEDADAVIGELDGKVVGELGGESPLKVNKARERERDRREGDAPRRGGGYAQQRDGGSGTGSGSGSGSGYQSRRTEGFRDWRTQTQPEEE